MDTRFVTAFCLEMGLVDKTVQQIIHLPDVKIAKRNNAKPCSIKRSQMLRLSKEHGALALRAVIFDGLPRLTEEYRYHPSMFCWPTVTDESENDYRKVSTGQEHQGTAGAVPRGARVGRSCLYQLVLEDQVRTVGGDKGVTHAHT